VVTVRISLSSRNHPDLCALIDEEDLPLVQGHRWYAAPIGHTIYATTKIGGKTVYMHRLLLDAPPHLMIDHIHGNGLDNRRCEIRLATRSQNFANRIHIHTNTSGYRGVSLVKGRPDVWQVGITKDGKRINLGLVSDPVQGARLYDAKARELFGEFAHLNFPN